MCFFFICKVGACVLPVHCFLMFIHAVLLHRSQTRSTLPNLSITWATGHCHKFSSTQSSSISLHQLSPVLTLVPIYGQPTWLRHLALFARALFIFITQLFLVGGHEDKLQIEALVSASSHVCTERPSQQGKGLLNIPIN